MTWILRSFWPVSFWAKFFTQFSCRLIRRIITLLTPWPGPYRKPLSLCTCHGAPWARDFDSSAPCTLSSVVDNDNRERRVTTRQFESITSAILGNVFVTPLKTTLRLNPDDTPIYGVGYQQYNILGNGSTSHDVSTLTQAYPLRPWHIHRVWALNNFKYFAFLWYSMFP